MKLTNAPTMDEIAEESRKIGDRIVSGMFDTTENINVGAASMALVHVLATIVLMPFVRQEYTAAKTIEVAEALATGLLEVVHGRIGPEIAVRPEKEKVH